MLMCVSRACDPCMQRCRARVGPQNHDSLGKLRTNFRALRLPTKLAGTDSAPLAAVFTGHDSSSSPSSPRLCGILRGTAGTRLPQVGLWEQPAGNFFKNSLWSKLPRRTVKSIGRTCSKMPNAAKCQMQTLKPLGSANAKDHDSCGARSKRMAYDSHSVRLSHGACVRASRHEWCRPTLVGSQ